MLSARQFTMLKPQRRLRPPSLGLFELVSTGFVDTATSNIILAIVTASATPHVKGAWVELVPSTTGDIHLLEVATTGSATSTSATSTLMDIGIGAAASETVIVPNVPMGYRRDLMVYSIPILIPSGSRIALRCQSAVGSKNPTVFARGYRSTNGVIPAPYCTTYGADTATSLGVAITAGSTNTKTAWTEITSATTERLGGIVVGLQANGSSAVANGSVLVDIGVGAAASETVVVPNIYVALTSTEQMGTHSGFCYAVDIPRGARLAVRYQTSTTTNGLDVVAIGVPWRR
jgi:hypothetical protein